MSDTPVQLHLADQSKQQKVRKSDILREIV